MHFSAGLGGNCPGFLIAQVFFAELLAAVLCWDMCVPLQLLCLP